MRDEQRFWQQVIGDVQRLARHGELTKAWPRSRVLGGICDEVHLRPALRGFLGCFGELFRRFATFFDEFSRFSGFLQTIS